MQTIHGAMAVGFYFGKRYIWMRELYEEKVFWGESFYSETLDFRGRINFFVSTTVYS